MRRLPNPAAAALLVLTGCASSEVTNREVRTDVQKVPRPNRIIVYDISATPGDVPPAAAITGHYEQRGTAQTPQEIELGRRLGALVAQNMVDDIRKMGLPAELGAFAPPPNVGDLLITGQFITVDEGSRVRRVTIGFGEGGSELRTHLEAYLVTETGHRLLGTREVQAASGQSPGLALPGVVSLATRSPIGIIVGGAANVGGEASGAETLEGAARRTSDEIEKELGAGFKCQGWI